MDRRGFFVGGMAAAILPSIAKAQMCSKAGGKFVGKVHLEQDLNGYFNLLAPYEYVDPCGKVWRVPRTALTDGASIPRAARLFVGDPFSGPYLNAAIVHDWYCVTRTESHDDVHRMFYNGMITRKVPSTLARIMYAAVCWQGPKWDALTVRNSRLFFKSGGTVHPQRGGGYALPVGPSLDPPTPVAAPDRGLLDKSRESLEAKDFLASEGHLRNFEDQVTKYDEYVKAKDEYASIQLKALSDSKQLDESQKRDQEAANDRFRKLIAATEGDGKSLADVARIAENFEGASRLLAPGEPPEPKKGVRVINPYNAIEGVSNN